MADQGVDADAIREAVDLFYERVLADPALSPLFAGIDMPHLRAHQRQFLLHILGGPDRYSTQRHQGRAQRARHHRRAVRPHDRAPVASLGEVGVAQDVVERAGTRHRGPARPDRHRALAAAAASSAASASRRCRGSGSRRGRAGRASRGGTPPRPRARAARTRPTPRTRRPLRRRRRGTRRWPSPAAAPISWPVPTQPYASAVSLNLTLAETAENITARAGARQMPATTSVIGERPELPGEDRERRADEDHEHAARERPRPDRQVAEREPADERRDRPDREHDARSRRCPRRTTRRRRPRSRRTIRRPGTRRWSRPARRAR